MYVGAHSTNSPTVHFKTLASRRRVSSVGFGFALDSSMARCGCIIFNFLANSTCVRPRAVRMAFKFMAKVIAPIINWSLYERKASFYSIRPGCVIVSPAYPGARGRTRSGAAA